MKSWIICDIDGTLANYSHRRHLIQLQGVEDKPVEEKRKMDWDGFHAASIHDPIFPDVVALLAISRLASKQICLMTGRPEKYRAITEQWLRNRQIGYDKLLMRSTGDFRSDVDVKRDLYQYFFQPREALFVLEDRDKVVEMWRKLNVTCLQVRKGDY
jgi:hypothetical protein